MDIRGWLEGTADRAHPDGSDHAADPNQRILGGDLSHRKPVARRSSRKRKRASSDSSIIATHRHGTRHAPESLPTVSSLPHVRQGSLDMKSCGTSSRSRSSSKPGSRGKAYSKYERRPRHKTRPDRYESKRKEERKQRRPRDDKEPKRRKSRRNHDRSRTTGLVQSFQLKNGPKNNRLTLRADANTGVFKHGRASAQVSGRGTGLPDLAFNELKFLQRPNEHQDAPVRSRAATKAKKHDRKQSLDEEISTYFAAHSRLPEAQAEATRQRKAEKPPAEVFELRERSLLGFGSRGVQPESRERPSDLTTVLSWSESVPGQDHSGKTHKQYDISKIRRARYGALHEPQPLKRRTTDSLDTRGRHVSATRKSRHNHLGSWIQSARAKRATNVDVYKPSVGPGSAQRRATTPLTRTTLESLPRHPECEQARQQDANDSLPQNRMNTYHTSDILQVDVPGPDRQEQPGDDGRHSDKENEDPSSPLSLDKMLSRLRDTATKSVDDRPPLRATDAAENPRDDITSHSNLSNIRRTQQRRQAAILQRKQIQQEGADADRAGDFCHAPMSTQVGSSTETPWRRKFPERGFSSAHDRSYTFLEQDLPKERYDTQAPLSRHSVVSYQWPTRAHVLDRGVEELAPRSRSSLRIGLFEAQTLYPEGSGQFMQSEDAALDSGEYAFQEILGARGDHGGDEFQKQQDQNVDKEFVGFWKPQRLY